MAGFQPARWRADVFDDADDQDDIGDWMAQRNAQIAARMDAEAAGRKAWEDAARSGQDVSAAQPSDVVALGARVMDQGAANEAPNTGGGPATSDDSPTIVRAQPIEPDGPLMTMSRLRFATARPGDSISTLLGTSDPAAVGRFLSLNGMDPSRSTIYAGASYALPASYDDASHDELAAGAHVLGQDNARLARLQAERATQGEAERKADLLNEGRNIWSGAPAGVGPVAKTESLPSTASWWDRTRTGRALAMADGYVVGLPMGVARGGLHAAEGLVDTAAFLGRLANPVDALMSPPGQSAVEQTISSGMRIADYVEQRTSNPQTLGQDMRNLGQQANRALNPFAEPIPATAAEAWRRGNDVGKNHGEIFFNVATIPVGGEVAEGAEELALARTALDEEGYKAAGMSPEVANYFAKLYDPRNMGSHWFSRDSCFPAWLGGGPLPPWFLESRYNVWKPRGATNGQIFNKHVRNDLRYGGGRLPDRRGPGSGWSGAKLGWTKNPPLERFINRMPAVTKGSVGGAALGGFDAARAFFDQDQPQ